MLKGVDPRRDFEIAKQVTSSLPEYAITKALSHIRSLKKATSFEHTCI